MAIHDDNSIARRGEQQSNIAIAFILLAWLFIVLRIWTRTYIIANFGWDDSTMILAGVIFTVYCATIIFIEANGGGTHVTDVETLVMLTKYTIVGEATYILTVMVLKVSLGIFFVRIVVKPWQFTTIYVAVAVSIVSSIASFFYVIFRCGVNLDLYVFRQLANSCPPRGLDRFFAYQQASFTTFTDCTFAILPIFILWNSNINLRSKISVGFILSLAALGCICSIIRFQYVDGVTQTEDFFWNATNVSIWSTIEPGAGIIAGCLATLRPFLKGLIIRARSICSSASCAAKEVFRSFQSNGNSSNQRSTDGSDAIHSNSNRSRRAANADVYPRENQVFELKSDVSQMDESMNYIFAQMENTDRRRPL